MFEGDNLSVRTPRELDNPGGGGLPVLEFLCTPGPRDVQIRGIGKAFDLASKML